MMYTEFLTTVTSPNGWNCITELIPRPDGSGTWARNYPIRFTDTAAVNLISSLQARGAETYFALGCFAQATQDGKGFRTQANTVALRSFWLDIDAGERKRKKHGEAVYATQQEAIDALNAELAKQVLPLPTYIVSSGEGLHIYWCCVEDISPAEWRVAADRLGRYCASVGLKVDSSRTVDCASVLRPIGTTHFTSGKPVAALAVNALFTKQQLLASMSSLPVADSLMAKYTPTYGLNALGLPATNGLVGQSSMGGFGDYQPSSFGKIIEKQQYERTGCNQLLYAYEHQAELAEPDWYAALSVAHFCTTDRDTWIHKLSHLHPKYERGETERKAAQAKGPTPCAVFEQHRPDLCKGCPHYGKITNPIVLGYQPQNRPTIVISQVGDDARKTDTFLIPELPFGFHRGQNGGVMTFVPKVMPDGKKSSEEMTEFVVCPQDTYIFERVRDGNSRQMYLCRYHSPHDGVIEFQLDSSNINSLKDFKDVITGAGLPINGKDQWGLLMSYFNLSRAQLINNRPAVAAVAQLGWQENGKDFVLGNTVITPTGSRPAPLNDSDVARKYAKCYTPSSKGDAADAQVELWRSLLHEMYGSKEAVANQFVICTAMGAPFSAKYALESHAGGIISLSSSGSGRGKTFTCQTALRIFGNPNDTTFSSKDGTTVAALMTTLGYLNSLPLLRDEVTELTPDEIVSLVYDSTRLGDKERAQGSNNDIRGNRNKWRTFFYATANTSLYDMVSIKRDVADGPIRRITEINVPELTYLRDNEYARQLASKIDRIRGVAGVRLLEWLVANPEKGQRLWERITADFIKLHGVTNEERYWANHLISGCVGAIIGEHLNLLPFKPSEVLAYAGSLLNHLRSRVGYRVLEQTDYLAQFLTDNTDHTLIIGVAVADELTQVATELPHKAVYIRAELANKRIFINDTLIKRWCADRRVVLADFEMQLLRRGGKPKQTKRMLANTPQASVTPPQKVWELPSDVDGNLT